MAKEWKALWEDYDEETGAEKTEQSSKPEKAWYYSDGRDNEDDEDKDRTILGFDTRHTEEDDRADTLYGGYGYSGGYGYYDGFDDSAPDWYRRGKWKYTRQADYSPSSQFRSTFSTRYFSSGDDDAKNKAIRALRNLTRSANTIVDKVSGTGQKSFTVQFSSGADSNGVNAELSEDKKRIVFVSPDDLLATSTTEDEDAVIDALTGFVLLRVQITQEIKPAVIQRINATGLHTAGFRAAEHLFVNKEKLAGVNPVEFGRDTTDDYLAGLLAKSLLTRLARRGIVANWGGFAPYFIRHAKKFAAVRENLEKAEKSVETVVGIIGYNMLADENQIELPKEINDIASKHLGVELQPEDLLDACRKLVQDIRDFLTAAAPAGGLPAGKIEQSMTDMMAKAKAEQSGEDAGNKLLRELLSAVAGAMGSAAGTSGAGNEAREKGAEADGAMSAQLKKMASLDQLIKSLESIANQLEEAKTLHKDARHGDAEHRASLARHNLSYTFSSRPQGAEALKESGIKEVQELLKTLETHASFSGAEAGEKMEQLAKLLKAVREKAEEFIKRKRTALKAASATRMEEMRKTLEDMQASVAGTYKKIEEMAAKLAEKPLATHHEQPNATAALAALKSMVDSFKVRLDSADRALPAAEKTNAGARSLATIKKAFEEARNAVNNALAGAGHCFYDNYSMHAGSLMTRLVSAMMQAVEDAPGDPEKAAEAAVEATMASSSVTDMSFMASLVDGFTRDMLTDALGDDPETKKKKADELGIDVNTLNKLLAALRSAINASKLSSSAKKLGRETAESATEAQAEFSPVDRHLFGDKIEAKTKVLTGESIGHVNDEARNAAEEDYVAYLDHNNCRPKVATQQESPRYAGGGHGISMVQTVKKKNKSAIERIRNALQFQSGKRTVETHGLRSGDLDEGSLHKLSYDCEHIWSQKTMSKLPDVAVGILVDQSGSMSGQKIDQARELCITLAEAIRRITGVRLYVYGHTANMHGGGGDLTIYEHYKPEMGADMARLGNITAHCNNYDGYAIKDVAKRLAEDAAKRKYLFVIADGLPAGAGYGGDTAEKHVTSVCKFTRDRLKIGTYAFAVGVNGHYQQKFKRQYGDNHVVFVDRVMKCLPQIVRFLRNALQQERKLVSVED